jgi:hypothetical protein
MAYTVEFYLQRYSKRVQGICQFESHLKKLDYDTIHREATRTAMLTAQDYNDDHGTNGFIRWFTRLTSDLCLYFLNNRDEYSSVLRGKKLETKPMETVELTEEPQPKPSGQLKHCGKCDADKPLDEFHNNKTTKDGKAWVCKGCMKKYWGKPKEETRGHIGTKLTPVSDSNIKVQLVLDNEEIEVIIKMYAEKLQHHLEETGKETERLTEQVQRWTAILNKRKST